MNWKNQYCQNDHTIQSNLQIQCHPCMITNSIFHRTEAKKNCTVHMKTQKIPNSQSIIKEKTWSWMYYVLWLQTILESYS